MIGEIASLLGPESTASGVAACTTSSLAPRAQFIKASFPGDAFFKTSSRTVKQIVQTVAGSH